MTDISEWMANLPAEQQEETKGMNPHVFGSTPILQAKIGDSEKFATLSLGDYDMHESEHDEQKKLFTWATWASLECDELGMLYAIPNGGKRDVSVAVKMKAEGVRAGVPDIFLSVAKSGYHGLYIEMKVKGRKPTKNQVLWLNKLVDQGYAAVVCQGVAAAKRILVSYIKGEYKV